MTDGAVPTSLPPRTRGTERHGGGIGGPGWALRGRCTSVELAGGPVSLLDQEFPASELPLASPKFFPTSSLVRSWAE